MRARVRSRASLSLSLARAVSRSFCNLYSPREREEAVARLDCESGRRGRGGRILSARHGYEESKREEKSSESGAEEGCAAAVGGERGLLPSHFRERERENFSAQL